MTVIKLDFEAKRKKYGRFAALFGKALKTQKAKRSFSVNYVCPLSCLHDFNRQQPWAKQLKELIQDKNDL